MTITENFIEELKLKNNIVDVVSSYATLTRSGGNHWARCPLPGHNERTASFAVNETGQFYHCFGCGRGGDVIKFVQEVDNLDFYDAVKVLADKVGMKMPEKSGEETKTDNFNRERMLNLLRDTALFYVHNLKNATEHINYLTQRKIDKSTLTAFGLGASLDYESLPKYLKEKGYDYDEMVQMGVAYKSEKNGKYIDSQATRLIIPIIDNYGKVIAFGGRWLGKTDKAKYKNTSETRLFVKNRTLYNVNNLKKYKKEVGELDNVIIVEGYMDTISVYKAGFKNVVASMGTSLTIQQAKLLKRYSDKVTICYDGDFAGQKGALRGLEILKNEGLEVKIASIPDGLDPDDIINRYGAEKFAEIIDNSMSLIEYKLHLIETKYGANSKTADKLKLIENSLKIIKESPSTSEQEDLLKALRDKTGITYESLKRDLERSGGEEVKKEKEVIVRPREVSDKIKQAQRFILASVLLDREYSRNLDIEDFVFEDEILAKLAEQICNGLKVSEIGSVFSQDELAEIDRVLNSGEIIFDTNSEKKYFDDCLRALQIDELEKEIDALNSAFEQEKEISARQMLIKHIQEKTLKLTRLRNGG